MWNCHACFYAYRNENQNISHFFWRYSFECWRGSIFLLHPLVWLTCFNRSLGNKTEDNKMTNVGIVCVCCHSSHQYGPPSGVITIELIAIPYSSRIPYSLSLSVISSLLWPCIWLNYCNANKHWIKDSFSWSHVISLCLTRLSVTKWKPHNYKKLSEDIFMGIFIIDCYLAH